MKANLLDKMLERAEELGWCYRKEEQESPLGNGQVDRYIEFERYTVHGVLRKARVSATGNHVICR